MLDTGTGWWASGRKAWSGRECSIEPFQGTVAFRQRCETERAATLGRNEKGLSGREALDLIAGRVTAGLRCRPRP